MFKWLAALFIILAATLGFAAQAKPIIKSSDMLRLICQEESSLNRDYRVTTDGLILVDFLGAVKVEGLTESEAATKIADQLVAEKILKKATITLSIISPDSKMVRFTGAIKLQGETPWKPQMKLSDVLRLAETTAETDLTRVQIKSANGVTTLVDATKPAPEGDPFLAAGDDILFFARTDPAPPDPDKPPVTPDKPPVNDPGVQPGKTTTVAIRGQITLPGDYPFVEGLTLGEAIVKAGGFLPGADVTAIQLERGGVPRALQLPTDNDFRLQPGDSILIQSDSRPKSYVEVRGSVRNPGRYEITEGTTLRQVIEKAGGFNNGARTDRVKIYSTGNAKPREINFEDIVLGYRGDLVMEPGQTVEVDGPRGSQSAATLSSRHKIAAGALAFFLLFGF